MKKRFLSMFLALSMVFTLLPGRAMATETETTNYDVLVGGIQVTSANADNVLEGTSNDGKVSYDPGTSTLTLNGINLEVSNDEGHGILFETDGTITLAPGSVNTVTTSGSAWDSIFTDYPVNLTINGSGSLNANNTTGNGHCAISVFGHFIIDGATVSATQNILENSPYGSYGIYASSLTIKGNSTVTASGNGGIFGNNGISIESGIVTGTGLESCGICTNQTLTISGGTVNSYGGSKNDAVWANTINLNGGTVTSTAVNRYKPFNKEPALSGMVHKEGTGTWDNTAGTACTYEEVIPAVDAAAPVITNDLNAAQVTYALGEAANVLDATATVSDGGEVTYDWYSNTANTTSGGTRLNVTTKTYIPSTSVPGITYYYCVVTNTNNSAIVNKTATVTSAIANIKVNAATYYDVWVGGTQVTSANASDVLGDGTVSYKPGTSTLTLNGINLEVSSGCGIEFRTDGTITLAPGSVNTVTTSGSASFTIYIRDFKNLTINGGGSLSANNTTGSNSGAIYVSGNLIIDGAKVSAYHKVCTESATGPCGINSLGILTIKGNSTVTAFGDSGIFADDGITIESGTVTGTGWESSGISTNKTLTINGGMVNSTGGTYSSGVWANTINLYGGTVTSTAVIGVKPFNKQPVLSGSMFHKEGTGTWDNTEGTSCTYEEVTPVLDAAAPVITNDLNAAQVTYALGEAANALDTTATVSGGGEVTYDWYSNTANTTSGGTKLNVTTKTYTPSTSVLGITYYYCVVTNTNNSAAGNKTAAVTSAIANIKVNAPAYTITLNTNGGSATTPSALTTDGDGKLTSLPTPSRSSRYRFEGWFTAARGGTRVTSSTVFSANATIYAHWTYIGGSSDNDGSDPVPGQPNPPEQKEDNKDSIKVIISDKVIAEAIDKAEAEGITLVLNLSTGNKTASGISINLPRSVQEAIVNKRILNTLIVVDQPDIKINMDLKAITEINKQAQADVNITAIMLNNSSLEGDAKAAISSRPVFELEVVYGSNKQVQSFGGGIVSVSIPYTLKEDEKAGNLCAVYVDEKGVVYWLANSIYDNVTKALKFTTPHFSTYGVGYRMDAPSFTDIANHYRKDDIEFVTARGLLEGTGTTTFEPDRAITRGMLVTALGQMANADVSSYKQSSFTDVKSDAYYMGYIEWANKMGILSGIDGKFSPDMAVTREHMAVILSNYAKAMGITLEKVYEESSFADKSKISDYAKDPVKELQMAGIITNRSNNLFDPTSAATRSEASAMLRRFIESTTGSSMPEGWIMNDSGKWMYYEKGKAVTGRKEISGLTYEFNQYGETASSPGKPIENTDKDQKEEKKEEMPKNPSTPSPVIYSTYRVKKGDSFWRISRIYKCSMYELAKINNKTIKDIIYPGEVLKIPRK